MNTRALVMGLAALLAVQLVLLWATRPQPPGTAEPAFEAPGLYAPALSSIELTNAHGRVVMTREPGEPWQLGGSLSGPADADAIEVLVRSFAEPVRAMAAVEERPDAAALARHGLTGEDVVRLRISSGEETLLDLEIGHEVEAGGTWLRAGGEGPILLANLPPRFRLEVPPSHWRDRSLAPFEAADVVALRSRSEEYDWSVERDEAGRWRGTPGWEGNPAGMDFDQRDVDQLARLLGELLARELIDDEAPLVDPALVLEVGLRDGQRLTFSLGAPRRTR